jgi:hypothetical protein
MFNTYELTTEKIPLLTKKMYDMYYKSITFKIFKISKDILLVFETNNENNSQKNYFLKKNNDSASIQISDPDFEKILYKFTDNHE